MQRDNNLCIQRCGNVYYLNVNELVPYFEVEACGTFAGNRFFRSRGYTLEGSMTECTFEP